MNEVINLVRDVEHVSLSQLTSISSTQSGIANIEYTASTIVPISKSNTRLSIVTERSNGNKFYNTKFQTTLLNQIDDLPKGIFLIHFENGSAIIIGEKDYPVKSDISESLTSKTLDFSYNGRRKPLKIAF